jgi:hypothetical protein
MSGDRDPKARVAWAALILFIAGLVLPFIFYAIFVSALLALPEKTAAQLAGVIGAIYELLALICGLIGWRLTPGKVAAIGSGSLIGLAAFAFVAFVFR